MRRDSSITFWLLGISAAVLLLFGNSLSIVGTEREYQAFGQTWTAKALWGTHENNNGCFTSITDKDFTFGGGSDSGTTRTCRHDLSFDLSLDSLDLSRYQAVTIHRVASLRASGEGFESATMIGSTIQGVAEFNPVKIGNTKYAEYGATLDNIIIVNDGKKITIKSGAYDQSFPAESLFLELHAQARGSTSAGFQYKITGIDLIPFGDKVPPVTEASETINYNDPWNPWGTTTVPKDNNPSWIDRIMQYIIDLYNRLFD